MTMMEPYFGEHGRIGGLQTESPLANLARIDDGGIAEGAVAVLQKRSGDDDGIGQGFLWRSCR